MPLAAGILVVSAAALFLFSNYHEPREEEYFFNWDRPNSGHPSAELLSDVLHPDEFTQTRDGLKKNVLRHVVHCPDCQKLAA